MTDEQQHNHTGECEYAYWQVEFPKDRPGVPVDIVVQFRSASVTCSFDLDTDETKRDFSKLMRGLPRILQIAMQETMIRADVRNMDDEIKNLLDPESD